VIEDWRRVQIEGQDELQMYSMEAEALDIDEHASIIDRHVLDDED
jgi:hypothetical protein